MSYKVKTTFLYTFLHFFVDFTTIFLLSGLMIGPRIGFINRGDAIIVYNLVAFAGQLPIGMISDVLNRNRLLVALGCALAGLSYPLLLLSPWVACIVAAIGNGVFHIGAGSEVLEMSMPKAGLSGLFVSSGALGVWMAYQSDNKILVWLCPVIMIISSIFLTMFSKAETEKERNEKIRYEKPGLTAMLGISCFMLTIVIRSLLGMVMDFSWKVAPILSLMAVLAVVLGKALGGFLGDRFGYIKVAVLSLTVSLVAFAFSLDHWVAGILAILCFNMTMPLTLTAIANLCGKKYGFAFGLTTFALAIGFLPVVFGAKKWFGVSLLAGGSFASLLLVVWGYVLVKKAETVKE